MLASFAIGAGAMAARDKAATSHATNASPTSHNRNFAAFHCHNAPALEEPPASGQSAPIILVDAGPSTDGAQAQQGTLDLVEALTTSWSDRRKAVASTGAARQKAFS